MTRKDVDAELHILQDLLSNNTATRLQQARFGYLCKLWRECKCRECGNVYDNSKARGDLKGFCSAKCQHVKARKCGYRKNGTRSEYDVLNAARSIGDVHTLV